MTERPSYQYTQSTPGDGIQGVDNAMISCLHTCATESVLEWPHFNIFPSIRQNYKPIFYIEQSRPPVTTTTSATVPYLCAEEVRLVIEAFQSSVNFFYPTMLKDKLFEVQNRVIAGNIDSSVASCMALLVMALGCASQVVSQLFNNPALTTQALDHQQSYRRLAEMYFDGVLKRLHATQLQISTESTQCLFFVALVLPWLSNYKPY